MALVPQGGPSNTMSREGSRTALVIQDTDQRNASVQPDLTLGLASEGTLRLRGGLRDRPRVAWGEDVVDNEGLGRKKSKICCIYHKPREFDESSSSESSGSESDSEDGAARPSGQYRHRHRYHMNSEGEGDQHGHGDTDKRRSDRGDRNAYERLSPLRKGKGKAS
ncbi:phosphatase inhibitor-domain-containing protein [Lactifluus subvellereus]|nr:phosphatase inhibitor-domain-containing protein [Lactifluus subvellereus]